MKIIKGLKRSLILFLIIISALFIHVVPSFATDPCTGGTATIDGDYTVRTFTSNGALVCTGEIVADIIFVAGGGGGGSNRGSGGGAGGIVVTSGSLPAYTYNIVIGAGGSGGTNNQDNATAGGNTTFGIAGGSDFVVNGGGRGRGGTVGGAYSALTGGDGVSAGGGCYGGPSGSFTGGQQGPTGSQGHAGGGSSNSSPGYGAGGGGGAGAAGLDGTSSGGGKGGDGLSNSITGAAKYYGGGGGGGQLSTSQTNSGGQGGGGNGAGYSSAVPATAGLNGYGGGGGGGGDGGTATYNAGAAGGSGVVMFRYLTSGAPVTFTITASAESNGSMSPSGDVIVNSGATQTFTVTPNAHYHIYSVTGCGGILNENTYTTGPITDPCNVTATFAIDTYTVTTSAGANGRISPSEDQTVNYGETASFTVIPNAGYSISSVTGCEGTLNENTYTTAPITAACFVSASFVLTGGGYNPVSGNLKYYYDDLNRLIFIEDTAALKLVEYQYDEVGNRTQKNTYNSSYLILAKSGNNGSITNAGATIVPQGSTQPYTYNITPAAGYAVADLFVDGVKVDGSSYVFNNVGASHIISATFKPIDICIGSICYASLEAAYNAANNGDTIKVTAKNLTENLNVNRNISVNLEGGYNQAHTSITGTTNLKGVIRSYAGGGSMTIKNFILQN